MNLIHWIMENRKDIIFFFGLVVALLAIYLLSKNTPVSEIISLWRWIIIIMVLFILMASYLITNNLLFGWLKNEQNRMSLSRLQMFLWTIVVLSAFITAVIANLNFNNFDTAVAIQIPEELWLAMGISVTSLVGSNLILEQKKDEVPKPPKSSSLSLKNLSEQSRIGILAFKEEKEGPSLLDLISGEEVSNKKIIDLTRLQNLFFTFVLVGTYMASIGNMFIKFMSETPEIQKIGITKFPELGSGAIALLTISHAGYLIAKKIDKQPSE